MWSAHREWNKRHQHPKRSRSNDRICCLWSLFKSKVTSVYPTMGNYPRRPFKQPEVHLKAPWTVNNHIGAQKYFQGSRRDVGDSKAVSGANRRRFHHATNENTSQIIKPEIAGVFMVYAFNRSRCTWRRHGHVLSGPDVEIRWTSFCLRVARPVYTWETSPLGGCYGDGVR